jgi:hypothetical protein
MNKAVVSILFCVSLFLAACGKNSAVSKAQPIGAENRSQTDSALRALLGVKGMDTEYQVPSDEPYYCVTTLKFEDGQRVGKGNGGSLFSNCVEDKPHQKQRIHLQFVWREENPKVGIFNDDGTSITFEDSFWQKLNLAFFTTPPTPWEGYTILGFATSNMGQDGQLHNSGTGEFQFELKDKKHVGALVIKTFRTKEGLREFMGLKSEAK